MMYIEYWAVFAIFESMCMLSIKESINTENVTLICRFYQGAVIFKFLS